MSDRPTANQIAEYLRAAAKEIRERDIPGWGNACEWGANEIERLERELAGLEEALRIIAGERQSLDNLMGNADIARHALRRTAEKPAAVCDLCERPMDQHGPYCLLAPGEGRL